MVRDDRHQREGRKLERRASSAMAPLVLATKTRVDHDSMEREIMNASFDYAGRNVFVAGGTSGINLGIARAFAAAGARIGVGSRSQQKVDASVAELSGAEPALGYTFDVRDHAAVAAALAAFAEAAGPIDVLVSGAAGNFPALARDISPNGFKAVVDIDLLGTFHVMKAAYALLRRPGGSVINISAPQAQVAMSHQAHVCAAKAGVDMLTRCLAIEWGPEGLRVNGVVPGPIRAPRAWPGWRPPARRRPGRRRACRCGAWAIPTTSPPPVSSSARTRRATSAARSCRPTAAGS